MKHELDYFPFSYTHVFNFNLIFSKMTYLNSKELQKAEKWANKKCVPFPELGPQLEKIKKKWDHGIYEEVYVFTGDNSPTIVHFVLVDKANLNSERKGIYFFFTYLIYLIFATLVYSNKTMYVLI